MLLEFEALVSRTGQIVPVLAPTAVPLLSPKLAFDTKSAHYRAGRQKAGGEQKAASFQSSWEARECC